MARLRAATTVLIGTDMDAPGERWRRSWRGASGTERCTRVSWLPYKDANEMLLAQGPQAVLDALAAAQPFPVPLDDEPRRARVRCASCHPCVAAAPSIELLAVEARHAR